MKVARRKASFFPDKFRAIRAQGAFAAARAARGADLAPEQDDAVAKIGAVLRREDGAELRLDLFRLFPVRQTQPIADPNAMRVADDGGLAVKVAQQQVCRLASDAREGQKRLHRVGHFAVIEVAEHLARQHDVARLVLVKSARMHQRLDLGDVGVGKGIERRKAREQRGRDEVHAGVGTLRRKPHGDHQLIIFFVMQRAQRVGIAFAEDGNDFVDMRHNATTFLRK